MQQGTLSLTEIKQLALYSPPPAGNIFLQKRKEITYTAQAISLKSIVEIIIPL